MNVISAYMLINKADPSTGGPYTVRFYDDDGNLIQTDANVPQYGDAHCTLLDGSIVGGLYFKGWNPSPYNIIRDLDCYPVRGDYIIRPEEIHDSWETICADGGAHYPLGAYKSLVISIKMKDYSDLYNAIDGMITTGSNRPILFNDHIIDYYNNNPNIPKYFVYTPGNAGNDSEILVNVSCDMVKVAEGEDGSTSTWLSTGLCRFGVDASYHGFWRTATKENAYAVGSDPSEFASIIPNFLTDYSDSTLNYLMETMLYRVLPTPLKSNIKSVTKTFKGFDSNADAYSKQGLDKTKLCRVWIPSRKELASYENAKLTLDSTVLYDPEYTGIDYSSVWMPSWETLLPQSGVFYLRSAISYYGMRKRNKTHVQNTNSGSTHLLFNQYNSYVGTDCIYAPFGFCL